MEDRELVYSILFDCFEKSAFSNLSFGKNDVDDFVRASVYGTLTYVYSEDFLIKKLSGRDVSSLDPSVRTILRFGVWQIVFSSKVPDYAAVNTSVRLASRYASRAKGFINAVLRKVASLTPEERNTSNYKSPEAAFSLKSEIYGVLKKSYGAKKASSIARSLLEVPGLSIRVNTLKTDKDALKVLLEKEGFEVYPSAFIEEALRIRPTSDSPSIENSKAYKDGLFMVQGEAAQLASVVSGALEGMKILDCCSAPGGKTTHLAALTRDKADILALDINASRIELVKQNAGRLGVRSVKTDVGDSSSFDNGLRYDLVLCDAPCSGLGLMGRKPDIRLTITYDRICEIVQRQYQILGNVSRSVKPGGILVYSTCTLNRMENENQVERFLDEHKDFELYGFDNLLPLRLNSCGNEGMLTVFPDEDECEGFFISRLRRKNG